MIRGHWEPGDPFCGVLGPAGRQLLVAGSRGWCGVSTGRKDLTLVLAQLSMEMVTGLVFPKDEHHDCGSKTGQKWGI
jgi:hypothetical protein